MDEDGEIGSSPVPCQSQELGCEVAHLCWNSVRSLDLHTFDCFVERL